MADFSSGTNCAIQMALCGVDKYRTDGGGHDMQPVSTQKGALFEWRSSFGI
ncbi:hypothetical protein ACT3CD_10360 [Geofilum sp. OHC36d9]|uniref:hypothetical protein n=1 Tax=Geofilum sp. OHC36d9 TaxID=3458413 RepID=UPI004034A439